MAQTQQGDRTPVAILGASGYTGAESIRLLARHPRVRLTTLTADRKAGGTLGQVFPHLAGLDLAPLVSLEGIDWKALDAAVDAELENVVEFQKLLDALSGNAPA